MNRLEWYRHLRKGWEPMKASHAWTQALVYDGKDLGDVYFLLPNGDPMECLTRITLANYRQGAWESLIYNNPFPSLLAKGER
jgi:hypothetical protein